MSRKALGIVLLFAAIFIVAMFAPALAKNFNDMPIVAVRNYWTGGTGMVALPSTWPTGGIHFASLVIYAQHVEAGTYGAGDSITIFVPYQSTILPIATFCTNAAEASFEKLLRSGTPAGGGTNTRLVSESDIKVERHGNHIIVELAIPQVVGWPKALYVTIPVTIPTFTMVLDQVGGSIHSDTILHMTDFTGASRYTVYDDNMGFLADGVFTCPAWGYMAYPMTNCRIVMHGINTNVPP